MYIVSIGTEGGQEYARTDVQVWRDILGAGSASPYLVDGSPVAWANLMKDAETSHPTMAATWMPTLLSVNDTATINGLDPIPQ